MNINNADELKQTAGVGRGGIKKWARAWGSKRERRQRGALQLQCEPEISSESKTYNIMMSGRPKQ